MEESDVPTVSHAHTHFSGFDLLRPVPFSGARGPGLDFPAVHMDYIKTFDWTSVLHQNWSNGTDWEEENTANAGYRVSISLLALLRKFPKNRFQPAATPVAVQSAVTCRCSGSATEKWVEGEWACLSGLLLISQRPPPAPPPPVQSIQNNKCSNAHPSPPRTPSLL